MSMYEQLCGGGLFGPLEEFWDAEAAAAASGEPSIVVATSAQGAKAALEGIGKCNVRLGLFNLGAGLEEAIYYWPAQRTSRACFARWMRAADLPARIAADKAALENGHLIPEQRIVLGRAVLRDGIVSVLGEA